MFTVRQRPLLLVADWLLSLRLGLNTPVVSIPDLPAGPARAAIAVHLESGRRCISVAVRSLRGGSSVLYELEGEDLEEASGCAVAVDAALSFGESMGFLFDDELITDRSAETLRRGLATLRELVAPPGVDEAGEERAAPAALDEAEILLEDEDAVELAPGPEPDRLEPAALELEVLEPAPVDLPAELAAPAAAAPMLLSKFRAGASGVAPAPSHAARPAAQPAGAPAPVRPATLGRVRPVRVRQVADGPPPTDPLLRLLAAF